MHAKVVLSSLAILIACTTLANADIAVRVAPAGAPIGLQCEYLTNPLSIEAPSPRLSWELQSDPRCARGTRQTAYQVLVASGEEALKVDKGDLWDSGRVASADNVGIEHAGHKLHSNQRCYWKVRVWNQDDQPSPWSQIATWTMGLLDEHDWQAKWIGVRDAAARSDRSFRDWTRSMRGPAEPAPQRVSTGKEIEAWIESAKMDVRQGRVKGIDNVAWSKDRLQELQPASLMRHEFTLASPVKRAMLRLCGLGCYELRLNGKAVDQRVIDPAETDYDRRAFYTTFEVTDSLTVGKNAVGVILGDGWYRQTVAFTRPGQPAAFGRQGLILQLEIKHGDGRVERIVSDEGWKCTLEGPLVKNAVFAGELYDARREMPGWDRPGFDDKGWSVVEVIPPLTPRLQAQLIPPIRVVETVKPVAISNPKSDVWVFDMGANLTGFARLKTNAPAGTAITMKFADTLDRNGLAFQPESLNLGTKSVDTYVCRGGDEAWEPRFTYHAFRYVQVEGLPGKPTLDMLEGRFVTNALEPAMHFECSNAMLNRLHAALVRTGMENTQHKWTDCPSREKTGWLSYPSFLIMMHNFNAQPFLSKLVADMEQKTHDMRVGDQRYANVSRGVILGRLRGSFIEEQAVSTILLPWELYLQYGDRRLLETHYQFMRDTMRYFAANARGGVLDSRIGDWHDALPSLDRPSAEEVANRAGEPPPSSLASIQSTPLRAEAAARAGRKQAGGYSIHTPPAVVSTACFHEAARAMSSVARLLHKPQDAEEYDRLADHIKAGFIATFYKPGESSFGSQTADALALWQEMVPPGSDDRVLKSLVHNILDTHHGHFSTGQLGTDRLLQVLSQRGRDDVAYTLMTQKEFPSFALMLNSGSTTTWETWGESILSQTPLGQTTPIAATRPLSHIEFTGVDAWFLQEVAGIRRDDSQPGFKAAVFNPHLVRQLDWARARYHTLRGWIGSDWRRQGDRFIWKIAVPPNMTATAYVPTKNAETVSENGQPATQAAGVTFLRAEGGYAVFTLQSGCFDLQSSL